MALSSRSSEPRAVRSLEWRIRLFGGGAVLALAGIFVEKPWLVTAALVVLLGGMGAGFALGRGRTEEDEEPDD